MTFQPRYDDRYDEERQVYRDCRFCRGAGCIHCPGEADREYKRQFPDGPKPIATFDTTTEEGQSAAKDFIKDMLSQYEAAHTRMP